MNFINRSHIYVLCLLAVVFSAASCNKNGLFPDGKGLSSQIRLSVKSGEPFSKSSAADDAPGTLIASYPLSDDPENDLVLNVYERDFTELPSLMSSDAEAAGTKGEVMTTSKLTTFQMLAYANGEWYDNTIASGEPGSSTNKKPAGLYFGGTDGIAVNRSGSGTIADPYVWDLATEQYWLNEVPISFWSWNGTKPAVAWNSTTERYDVASLTGFTVAGASGTAVTSQVDPIFAYNGESRTFNDLGSITGKTSTNSAYTRTDNEVDIHFYHALAAVNFDISQVAPGSTVDNIKLSNIYSVGDCDITVSGGIPQFEWKNRSDKSYFSQAFTASDFNTTDPQKGRQPLATSQKVFLMIPQTLESDATITVTFNGTDNVTRPIPLDDGDPQQWLPGKYYTYAIQRLGDVKLDIMGPLEPVKTTTVDAHYENVMLRFGKSKPGASKVEITDQDGTAKTAFDPLSSSFTSTPTYADWIRFAAPTNASTFAGYPGVSGSVDIAGLLQELAGDGAKDHFYTDGTYYYTQAFVNEYVLGSGPSDYVGKADRGFKITLSKDTTIGTGDPSVEISQKAMQSPYNLSAANPFGVELVEESSVTVGDGTTAADWCMSRNRDEDGNGSISGSEIKWRTPSLQEYWNIWYGTHSIAPTAWLGLSTSPARTLYLSNTSGLAYNGQLSTTVSVPSSGTGTVRCIRDLGSGSNAMYSFAEVPGILDNGETTTKYVLTMNDISSASMRSKISNNELTVGTIDPGAGTDAAHNKLYSKIQVASQYLTWPTGGTTNVPILLYYLAVEKDEAKAIEDYDFNVTYNSSGNITLIEGSVKMINPDPRLVYISSFAGTTGGKAPDDNWSMVDENGVLHFRVESSGWTANNSGLKWDIKAAINNGDGTFKDLEETPKICTLVFYVKSDNGSNFNNPWGQTFNINKVGNVTLIGDGCIALGSSGRYCRLGVQDAGPYTLTDVKFPEVKEEFDGTTEGKDDKPSADYLCKTYYYEDQRAKGGQLMKADLGQWRAPSQRELSIMLANRDNLKIMKATPKGTGEYEWSKVDWAITDKVFSPRITYSDGVNDYKYFNSNGYLSTGGSDQAPYKIRCVRDIE